MKIVKLTDEQLNNVLVILNNTQIRAEQSQYMINLMNSFMRATEKDDGHAKVGSESGSK